MKNHNQLYYQFRIRGGREEYHVSYLKNELEVGNNEALCSSIPIETPQHLQWKEGCLREIKVYKMKEVKYVGV